MESQTFRSSCIVCAPSLANITLGGHGSFQLRLYSFGFHINIYTCNHLLIVSADIRLSKDYPSLSPLFFSPAYTKQDDLTLYLAIAFGPARNGRYRPYTNCDTLVRQREYGRTAVAIRAYGSWCTACICPSCPCHLSSLRWQKQREKKE